MIRPLPEIAAARRLSPLPREVATLSNGLKVIAIERRGVPVVDLQLVVMRGATMDVPARAGRVRMTAEMLDEGTHLRAALDIAEQLDYLGANLDVNAGWDSIVTSLHVLSPRFEAAVEILGDLIVNASFPEQEFRRKREERLGALRQEEDEAAVVAGKTLARAVFGDDHPYGAPLSGTIASIEALTCHDSASVYRQIFSADNAFAVVVGDIDTAAVVRTLEANLAAMPAQRAMNDVTLPTVPRSGARVLLVDKPDAAQAELRVGHPGPSRSTADFFPLIVMNTMLGGFFTSRLNMILRERMGVTYGARSRFSLRRGGGLFSAGAAVDSEAAARSAQVVIEEMERMASQLVAPDELRRAQNYIALGLPRQFETTEDIAVHVREEVLYGLPQNYWEQYVDRVFAVSAEDVRTAAARHLHTDASVTVVVADREEVAAPLQRSIGNKSLQLIEP